MGPFPDGQGGHFDLNASHLIARALPSHLKLPAFPGAASNKPIQHTTRINILNPTAATPDSYIPTEYGRVRQYVHDLHNPATDGIKPDLMIHLGQGPPVIWIERFAFSQAMSSNFWTEYGYKEDYYRVPDNIGETIDDVDGGLDPWAAQGVPIGLCTALNVDGVLAYALEARRLRNLEAVELEEFLQPTPQASQSTVTDREVQLGIAGTQEIQIFAHHEPGPYLCGFIYYESLANCYVQKKRADVLFCHVPRVLEPEEVKKGAEAVECIIIGAVKHLLDREEYEFARARFDEGEGR
jgi:hypothetical protein